MPYKAIKKFEFDGVIFKIGDTVPDRLIIERLINASTLVEEITNEKTKKAEEPKVELLLETPTAAEAASQEVKIEETNVETKEEILVETNIETIPEVKKDFKKGKK